MVTCRALDIDTKYYGDGEDGVRMEQDLVALQKELGIKPFKGREDEPAEKTKEKKGSM